MSLKIDRLQLEIVINNDQSRVQLRKLEEEAKQLRNELKKLPRDTEEFAQKSARLKSVVTQMDKIKESIGLTGLTTKELKQRMNELRLILNNLDPRTAEWKKYNEQLKAVTARYTELTQKTRVADSSLKNMANMFNRYFLLVSSFVASITGIVFSIKNMIKGNAELSDSLSNVMKTTGLTRTEVREFYADLKYLNTRTSRKELLMLAEEAGRLGKESKKDIMDFVEVGNMINVALGDDLGDNAGEAIKIVGKLTDIYKIGEKHGKGFRDSMLMMGSAINEVSANSQAEAPFLIDFLKRMGGIADQTNITADAMIGYAAVLDEKGQAVEMSSTAIGRAIVEMFKDTASYAEIAGMNISDFTNLMNKDANEAFLKVLEGLNSNNEGLTVMAKKLDGLDMDGARAVQVLSAIAGATDTIRDRQNLANKSLIEATSLTKEYNVKNDNLAGNLERVGKAIRSWFINSTLLKWLENVVGWMARMVNIPITEKIEKERIEVNKLSIELMNSNTEAERRNEIYETLKNIAPKVLENIEKEAINVDLLKQNLKAFNDEMIKKIALQESENILNEKRQEYGKSIGERLSLEDKLMENLLRKKEEVGKLDLKRSEQIENILLSETDILSKEKEIRSIIEELNKERGLNVVFATQGFNLAGEIVRKRERELELEKELNKSLDEYKKKYEHLFSVQKPDPSKPEELGPKIIPPELTEEEKKKLEKINTEIKELRRQLELDQMDSNQREIAQIRDKYARLIEEAKGYHSQISKLEELRDQEIALKEKQQAEKKKEEEDKKNLELLQKKQDLENQIYLLSLSNDDREIAQVMQKYDEMIALAQQYGIDTTALYAAMNNEIDALNKKRNQNEKNSEKQTYDEILQDRERMFSALGGVFSEFANLVGNEGEKMGEFQKALVGMQLLMDTAAAISSLTRYSEANPANWLNPFAAVAFYAAGIARILANIAAAKKLLEKAEVPQYYKGKYEVIGEDDGKLYSADYVGRPKTGIYSKPTLGLFSEREPELIINGRHLKNIQMNYPEIIRAIEFTRVPQYASGQYPGHAAGMTAQIYTDPYMIKLLEALLEETKKPFRGYVVHSDIRKADEIINEIEKQVNRFSS